MLFLDGGSLLLLCVYAKKFAVKFAERVVIVPLYHVFLI